MKKSFLLSLTLLLFFSLDSTAHFNDTLTTPAGFSFSFLRKNPPRGASKNGAFKIRKIVIDAGHGGKDGGCSGANSSEKHIALGVAKKLGAAIGAQFSDVEVIYTRDKDVFIPLHKRTEIANKNNADLFISIHCNYIVNAGHVKGSETYVMGLHTAEHNLRVAKRENEVILLEENYEKNYGVDPNSPEGHIILAAYQHAYLEQSILFAEKVEKKIAAKTSHHSRGVKQAGFFVLKEATMPSVLIETGYLSNAKDEAYLLTESGQNEIAGAVLDAFKEYKSQVEGTAAAAADTAKTTADAGQKPVAMTIDYDVDPATDKPFKTETKTASAIAAGSPAVPKPGVVSPAKSGGIHYRVQLAAAKTPVNMNEQKWQNVGYTVEVIEENALLKYQAKSFATFEEAAGAQKTLRQKGFPDAFIVAYKDGAKISLADAKAATN